MGGFGIQNVLLNHLKSHTAVLRQEETAVVKIRGGVFLRSMGTLIPLFLILTFCFLPEFSSSNPNVKVIGCVVQCSPLSVDLCCNHRMASGVWHSSDTGVFTMESTLHKVLLCGFMEGRKYYYVSK